MSVAQYQNSEDFVDPWDIPSIGRPLINLLCETLETKVDLHPWLPAGLTLLSGKTKSGKSTLSEQIAYEISLEERVLYLALEYNKRMAKQRFSHFTPDHQIHIVLEGEINRFGQGGQEQLDELIYKYKPKLVIVDILAKIKRDNNGHYDSEYKAMTEIKELVDKYDADCLVLTHSGKPTINSGDDPFDKIIGSTALQGVPDNLMLLRQSNGRTELMMKGRLINPNEKSLDFDGTKYRENASIGYQYEDKAPIQAKVLDTLRDEPKTVKSLATELGRDKGQISNVCKSLADDGKIMRKSRNEPWRLNQLS